MGWKGVAVMVSGLALWGSPLFAQSAQGPDGGPGISRLSREEVQLPGDYAPSPERQRALAVIQDPAARTALERNPHGVMTAEEFKNLFPQGVPPGVVVLEQTVRGVGMVKVVLPRPDHAR